LKAKYATLVISYLGFNLKIKSPDLSANFQTFKSIIHIEVLITFYIVKIVLIRRFIKI